jgi:hypothetical protein
MEWLRLIAAIFLGIAGMISLSRYFKSRNNGQLFVPVCFLLSASIFAYLAIW